MCETVELGHYHRLYQERVHHGEHAGPLQALRRLASIHEYVEQLGIVYKFDCANFYFLRFERNTVLGLVIRRDPRVANGSHDSESTSFTGISKPCLELTLTEGCALGETA